MIPIYQAHPGPYSLMITRTVEGKKVPCEIKGPCLAHAAHELARALISDPTGTATEVFIYSEKEKQFIGAMYFRGTEYAGWSEEEIHALANASQPSGKPDRKPSRRRAEPSEESVRDEDADVASGDGDGPGEPSEPVRVVHRTKQPGDRFPAVRGRSLALGTPEGWPPSRPAQMVKEFFGDGRTATVAEVVQALGPALKDIGMEFPAALVSRLKQRGLLKENTE